MVFSDIYANVITWNPFCDVGNCFFYYVFTQAVTCELGLCTQRESFHIILQFVFQAQDLLLLTAGLTMPSTMRLKLHINKTPLNNNRAPKLRPILHKTLLQFSVRGEKLQQNKLTEKLKTQKKINK